MHISVSYGGRPVGEVPAKHFAALLCPEIRNWTVTHSAVTHLYGKWEPIAC